jgi:putative transposase
MSNLSDLTRSHTDLLVENALLHQHWVHYFMVVNYWIFRQWYIFVVMELLTWRIVHTGVTKYPTDEWTAQQLREATPWGKGPKCPIRDRDKKYATQVKLYDQG